ncbi:MAG: methylmalonyl Co-A mutase-associated GTPase MeaB, partial [Anaerolineae bacterium]
ADVEGADHAVMALRMMLDLDLGGPQAVMHHGRLMEVAGVDSGPEDEAKAGAGWRPPIVKTVATRRQGIAELAGAIDAHRAYLAESGRLAWRERARAAAELEAIVQQESLRRVLAATDAAHLRDLVDRIVQRQIDPYTAGRQLLAAAGGPETAGPA